MSTQTILVVDDSRAVRLQIQRILIDAGYEVITAENGVQAIDQLKNNPCLMILDVLMPELDGYGVCEKLDEMSDQYGRLPIVFLTAVDSNAMELLGRQYGVYLQKPINPPELLTAVQYQLESTASF